MPIDNAGLKTALETIFGSGSGNTAAAGAQAVADAIESNHTDGATGTADALGTTGADVDVGAAAPPSAGQVLTAVDATHATWQAPAGGGAPTAAQYLVLSADATLTQERVLTLGNGLDAVDSGAGAAYTLTVDETELDHAALGSNRAWGTSGHTGTASRVAAFDGGGAASYLQVGVDLQGYHADLAAIAAGTWTGAGSITTVGTITTGTWHGAVVAIGYGGTGQTTQTAAFDALSPMTTKGDLIGHDGVNNVRVGVGLDGRVLTADAASGPGWKWSAPSWALSGAWTATGITGTLGAIPMFHGTTGVATYATEGVDYYKPGGTDVAPADGGTGLSTYAEGDVLYASAPNTLAKLAAPATGARDGKSLGWNGNSIAWVYLGLVAGIRITSTDTPLTGGRVYADNADGNAAAFIDATVP